MNAGGRKKAGAVLLTLTGITAIFLLLTLSLKTMENTEALNDKAVALTNIRQNLNRMVDRMILEEKKENEDDSEGNLNAEGEMAVYTIQDMMSRGHGITEGPFGNGYIIRHTKDAVFFPPDLPYAPVSKDPVTFEKFLDVENKTRQGEQTEDIALFKDDKGKPVYHISFQINDSYEFTLFMTDEERSSYFGSMTRLYFETEILAQAYECKIALIDGLENRILVWPFEEEGTFSPEDIGMDVSKNDFNISGSRVIDSGRIQVDDKSYDYDITTLALPSFPDVLGYAAIVFNPVPQNKVFPLPTFTVVLMAGFIVIFMIWILNIYRLINNRALSENLRNKYMPSNVVRKSIGYALVTGLAVFLAAMYLFSLNRLFLADDDCNKTIDLIFEGTKEIKSEYAVTKNDRDNHIVSELKSIASFMEKDPDLINTDYLEHMNKIMHSSYMVIYDSKGKQLLTNSGLRGLYIGGPGDPNSDFEKLLNGVSSVIIKYPNDEVAGSVAFAYGVPVMLDDKEKYGVLSAYFPEPDYSYIFSDEEFQSFYSSNDRLFFTVNTADDPVIVTSSRKEMVNNSPFDLGMVEGEIRGNFMDFFRLFGTDYYGHSAVYNEDLIYYVAIPLASILNGTLRFGLFALICYAVLFSAVSVCLLWGFKDTSVIFIEGETDEDEKSSDRIMIDGRQRRYVDVSERWQLLRHFHFSRTPEGIAIFTGKIIIFVIAVLAVIRLLHNSHVGNEESIINYCIAGNWERDINIFSITSILVMAMLVWSTIVLVDLISYLISRFSDTKTETIGRLVMGIIKYILIILLIYQSISLLGFDTRAVLASLGLAGLAISLGARDMIADIISGLTIVFEGEFQVGDIVEIDGFIGTVEEVGVRTTKLKGRGENIKIISNRNISDVVNRTHLNSWCTIEVEFSHEQPIDEVEKVFEDALPLIGRNIPEIISGPVYKGVLAFNGTNTKVSIIAECKEKDYHKVEREVLGALNHVCRDNNLKLG